MKTIKELVSIVTKKKMNKIDVFDSVTLKKENTLYTQFFHAINEGKFNADEDAATLIYNESPGSKKYLMLKGRMKERLVNTLLFLENRKQYESELLFGVYVSNRNYFAAKTLSANGASISALEYAKSSLNLSIKYQQTELILLNSRLIKSIIVQNGLKDFKKYDTLCRNALILLRAENGVESYYQELIMIFKKSKSINSKVIALTKNYYLQSKNWAQTHKSFQVKIHSLRIGMIYYQVIRNYRLLINTANRFEKLIIQNPLFSHKSSLGEIALFKMSGYMYLKDFENGKKFADKGSQLFRSGSANWFVFNEHYFLLAMHTCKFAEAEKILENVFKNERFEFLNTEDSEKWKLFEAYLQYMYPENRIEHQFRILKFVNDVQAIAKDKGGINPAILIIQLLHLIQSGNWDDVINRSESLRVYVSRNLSPKLASRTILFSKLLVTAVKYKYDPELLNKRSEANVNKLMGIKISDLTNSDSLEIVPYEDLWKLTLKRIQTTGKI